MNGCKDDQSVRTDLPVNPNLRAVPIYYMANKR